MTGRTNPSRVAAIHGIHKPNERYFPLSAAVIPGYARNSPPLSNPLPTALPDTSSSYRDIMTIRAVSQDCDLEEEEGDDTDDSLTAQHSPTTPPRTPSRSANHLTPRFDILGQGQESPEQTAPASPNKSRLLSRTALAGFPPFSDLSISANRSKDASPAEGRRRGTSPTTERPTTMGVVQSPIQYHSPRYRFGSPQDSSAESTPNSVGFPSTQSPTPTNLKPHVRSRKQRFLRNQISINTLNSKSTEPPLNSPITPADTGTVFRLMKELRGRMEGYVEFRVGDNMIWVKGYCLINEDTGNLIQYRDENISSSPPTVIIPDLRGCQVKTPTPSDEGSDGIIEVSTHNSNILIKLHPLDSTQFVPWLAALLCWQPIPPAGPQNKMVKPQTLMLSQERKADRRRNSDATMSKDAAIIKVGKMLLWRRGEPNAASQPTSVSGKNSSRVKSSTGVTWQKISCTLQENGEFKMYAELDTILLAVILLQQLSRCAVQQLDTSILDKEFCIAIYPQYSPFSASGSLARPVYLSIDSRILFEVWFVLLRAFTMPELYGPACVAASPSPSSSNVRVVARASETPDSDGLVDSYRIQRNLFLRVVESKITMPNKVLDSLKENLDCYAEVVLDGEVRAKTMVRTKTHNPFWREDYEFPDLPAILWDVGVVLKQRHPRWKTKGTGSVTGSGGFGGGLGGASVPGSNDAVIGRVDIQLGELKFDNDTEGWWPLISSSKGTEEKVGEMFLKIRMEELIVLMAHEYKGISDLLHNFSNGITMEIAQVISPDLRRLADTLLKIYQVNGKASEWLMSLAEGEIDGLHKESIPMRPGLGRHWNSDESYTSDQDAPHPRRNVGKSALVDANILFRGNSLLTKALDAHMKRLGREYLEETLSSHLWKIVDEDTYCEIDPVRMEPGESLPKNWKVLMGIVNAIWGSIYKSSERCPIELKKILRHIKVYVKNRYGDMLRTISYSSVCGFLFLRFFCPAILNPKLFGLLKDHPGVRAQRTLTLVAKSLQGLANMTTFGVKEPWMEPMNEFLQTHGSGLRKFVDDLTAIPPSQCSQETVPPSYATPITILSRLSQPSKEGFPSLPFLIDQPRAFAALVSMWLKWYPIYHDKVPEHRITGDLGKFHKMCLGIHDRIRTCVEKAENAERPSSSLSARWEEVAERATGSPLLGPGQVLTMFPMTTKPHRIVGTPSGNDEDDTNYTFGQNYSTHPAQHRSKSKFSGFVGGFKKKVKSRTNVGRDHDE